MPLQVEEYWAVQLFVVDVGYAVKDEHAVVVELKKAELPGQKKEGVQTLVEVPL